MRYGIDIGHNCPPDTGARGIRFEDDLTKEVGNLVIAKLKSLGHQVIECKFLRFYNFETSSDNKIFFRQSIIFND